MRKVIIWVVVIIAVLWLINNPTSAADAVSGVFGFFSDAASSVGRFFGRLTGGGGEAVGTVLLFLR